MDTYALRMLLRQIDAIQVEDISKRYGLLCELLAFVKREATSPAGSAFDSNDVLLRLIKSIDAIPVENIERRYFQLVSLMIFVKRQALLDPSYQAANLTTRSVAI